MLKRCCFFAQEADEFLLLACDGIYDVMNNQELVDFIRWRLKTDDDLCHITNDIVDACLSKVNAECTCGKNRSSCRVPAITCR